MKKLALLIGLMLTFGILANAQSMRKQITAHIPFDFYVQNQKMAEGDYVIESASLESNQSILVIRQKDGKAKRILVMNPMELNESQKSLEATIFFNRYGNDYFLAEIRNPAEHLSFELPMVKAEKQLAQKFGKPTRETIAVSMARK